MSNTETIKELCAEIVELKEQLADASSARDRYIDELIYLECLLLIHGGLGNRDKSVPYVFTIMSIAQAREALGRYERKIAARWND